MKTRTKFFTALVLLLCLALPLAAQEKAEKKDAPKQPKQQPIPEGTQVLRDLEYVPGGHERQKLDLYLPETGEKLPLIVWIHGGGWQNGSKANPPGLAMTRRGYAIASFNYRLSQHAVWPAQIQDCKAALRWLRANAAKYRLDPDHVGVWGASAGGHLVAMLGAAGDAKDFDVGENLKFSSRVQAVCDWFGPTDFTQMSKFPSTIAHDEAGSPESKLIGGAIQENKDKAARANPITFVSKSAAPFLIMHGDKDPLVPFNQSELLEAALKQAGVEVTLVKIEGAGHGGPQFSAPENTAKVVEFFDRHLKQRVQ
ncbi:MAG: alpha/beta hydrolase [Verrucomicrobia bacterium]|nr:alpha/beta hydrolase [Verrucomicrobiota bacterium]